MDIALDNTLSISKVQIIVEKQVFLWYYREQCKKQADLQKGTHFGKVLVMVFSSLVFLWIFLPITIIGHFLMKENYRNIFLLLASLIFYSWGEPVYVLLMICSIFVNWMLGILMDKLKSKKRIILFIAVLVNLMALGYFKYFNFLIEIVNNCFNQNIEMKELALPIGISFFTFQALSYIIDLYYGKYEVQKNILNVALYISFFPQLIAGPIVQYKDINNQLNHRVLNVSNMAEGVRRFIYGLSKKVLVSNVLAKCVDAIYQLEYADVSCQLAWIAAIFYSLQIYYDFSGYSDMAIGLGKIFGFDFKENFQYPYISSSIQEFWQRWHISLGTWFKEYVYIPLGGNRKGKFRTYTNLAIVFFITGLWHGAGYTFVLWGMYHGVFSIIERLGLKKFLDKHKWFSHIYTLILVNFGWVLFRAENVIEAGVFIKHMLMPWKFNQTSVVWQQFLGNRTIFVAFLALIGCGMIQSVNSNLNKRWRNSYLEIICCGIMMIFCIAALASNTYNPFIYFRF